MKNNQVNLMATLTAKKGCEIQLKDILQNLIDPTRKEQGCIHYYFHEISNTPGTFIFYEQWASKNDLDNHMKSEHFTSCLKKCEPFLAKAAEITFLNLL